MLDRLVTLRAASRWRHGETVMVSPPFSRRLQVPRRNRARAMGLAVLVTARVGAGQPVPPPDGEPETPIEIVIVGDAPQPLAAPKDPHVSGSVISGEALRQPGTFVADALRTSPGVQVVESGGLGAPATASLRGATAAQTPVYFGGIRINDEVGGAANLAELPLFLVERIEVYRSHAPLSADELGIGGAVFLEPRKPDGDALLLSGLVGSHTTRGVSGFVSRGDGASGFIAGFELSAAENDYTFYDSRGSLFDRRDDASARLENADVTTNGVWLVGRERVGSAQVGLLVAHVAQEQGAPKLAQMRTEEARVAYSRQAFALGAVLPVDAWNGALELSSAATLATTEIDDPLRELGLLTPGTRTPGERLQHTLRARQRIGRRLALAEQLSLSFERLRRDQVSGARFTRELTALRMAARAALAAELELARPVFVSVLAATGCIGTKGDAGSLACREHTPSGRIGLSVRGATSELYANAGRYFRQPTLSELYGASILERGNSGLLPERGSTVELGGRYQRVDATGLRRFWIDAAVFARWSKDLVTRVVTAQGYVHPVNRKRARALGAEVALGAAPAAFVDARFAASLLDPRDTSPDRATANDLLPFHSRLIASARLELHGRPPGPIDEAALAGELVYQSSRYADPAGLGAIPEQAGLVVELRARAIERRLTTRLRIANALDARRFDVVGFPLPGRSVFGSLEATW